MKRILSLTLCIILSFASITCYGQGWTRGYSPDHEMAINSFFQLPDSSYWVTGFNTLTFSTTRMMRISPEGNVLQVIDLDSISGGYSMGHITPDKGMAIISPIVPDSVGSRTYKRGVLRTDASGNKLWLKNIHTFNLPQNVTGLMGNLSIDTTDDNGFICGLNPYDTGLQRNKLLVKRLDAQGDILWERSYYDTSQAGAYVTNVINAKDGSFIGQAAGFGAGQDWRIFKIDPNGDFLWEYLPSYNTSWATASVAMDGNIFVYGADISGLNYLAKLDQAGNELWVESFLTPTGHDRVVAGLVQHGPNKFALLTFDSQISSQGNRLGIIQIDSSGNLLSERHLPTANLGANLPLIPLGIKSTLDKGMITGGVIDLNNPSNYYSFMIKTDSTGQVYPNTISGYTYYDTDVDCIKDNSEASFNGNVISFSNAVDTFVVMTHDSGYYSLGVNSGLYDIAIQPANAYWQQTACAPTQVNIPQTPTDTIISFSMDAQASLPFITINANMRPRFCSANTYTIEYCNSGPSTFYGAIQLEFDSILQIDSASVGYNTIAHNTIWVVEGSGLALGECRSFLVHYSVPCDPNINLATVCVNAHAYNDSVVSLSTQWDMSDLQIDVEHNTQTDSVEFIIENIGNGDMAAPQPLIVIEDNVIMMSRPLQLNAGEIYVETLPANGSTWRGRIDQTPFNPRSAFSTAAIERAGLNQLNTYSRGFINQFPINGFYGFDYSTCEVIRNSFDPNQKTVYPQGVAPNNMIDSTTQLEYRIDFQNTGNDTAYIVRIVDTLAPYLDPTTIKLGVSSHDYTFKFLSSRVIEFTFEAIYLPDSTTDEAGSQGFVKFKIDQVANNTDGIVIDNDVAIYFDFNAPIMTNTARVTIGSFKFTDVETVGDMPELDIKAWPNPFTDHATVKVSGANFEQLELMVYDLSGRVVQRKLVIHTDQVRIDGTGLGGGTYIFQVVADGKEVGKGKLVFMP